MNLEKAIFVDEIGIESGIYGDCRLKTVYQPVYERCGDRLSAYGVEARIRPFQDGLAISARSFFGEVPAEDRLAVEHLCRALHLGNHRNIGVDGLHLFLNLNLDPSSGGEAGAPHAGLERMALRVGEIGFDPGLLICEISGTEALGRACLGRLATRLRHLGIRLAIDDFGTGFSTLDRVEMLRPEIVRIDGEWFRRVSSYPRALRLVAPLVAGFQRLGARVLIEGIETPFQLGAALDAGADLLQGYLLGRPKLAGAFFDEAPLIVEQLVRPDPKVVSLRL